MISKVPFFMVNMTLSLNLIINLSNFCICLHEIRVLTGHLYSNNATYCSNIYVYKAGNLVNSCTGFKNLKKRKRYWIIKNKFTCYIGIYSHEILTQIKVYS